MKFYRTLQCIALMPLLTGLVLALPLGYFWLQDKAVLSHHTATVAVQPLKLQPSATLITGTPVEISIPSLKMDLQVIPGVYNQKSGQWTLTDDKAQFAEPSVTPNNETGNTLIYGHYRPQVFAYLHHIQPGAQAVITTVNGYKFTYTYQTTQAFDPTDTSIFTYQGVPRLTIQTCSGSFMQNRQMYYFQYSGYTPVS